MSFVSRICVFAHFCGLFRPCSSSRSKKKDVHKRKRDELEAIMMLFSVFFFRWGEGKIARVHTNISLERVERNWDRFLVKKALNFHHFPPPFEWLRRKSISLLSAPKCAFPNVFLLPFSREQYALLALGLISYPFHGLKDLTLNAHWGGKNVSQHKRWIIFIHSDLHFDLANAPLFSGHFLISFLPVQWVFTVVPKLKEKKGPPFRFSPLAKEVVISGRERGSFSGFFLSPFKGTQKS